MSSGKAKSEKYISHRRINKVPKPVVYEDSPAKTGAPDEIVIAAPDYDINNPQSYGDPDRVADSDSLESLFTSEIFDQDKLVGDPYLDNSVENVYFVLPSVEPPTGLTVSNFEVKSKSSDGTGLYTVNISFNDVPYAQTYEYVVNEVEATPVNYTPAGMVSGGTIGGTGGGTTTITAIDGGTA